MKSDDVGMFEFLQQGDYGGGGRDTNTTYECSSHGQDIIVQRHSMGEDNTRHVHTRSHTFSDGCERSSFFWVQSDLLQCHKTTHYTRQKREGGGESKDEGGTWGCVEGRKGGWGGVEREEGVEERMRERVWRVRVEGVEGRISGCGGVEGVEGEWVRGELGV